MVLSARRRVRSLRRLRRLFLEPLEDRRLLAVYAFDDFVSTAMDSPVGIGPTGNDYTDDGMAFWIESVGSPSNGSLVMDWQDSFTYTPNPGFFGSDGFGYTVVTLTAEGNYEYGGASVTIEVANPSNDAYYTGFNTTLTAAEPGVLSNDNNPGGGPIYASLVGGPSSGGLDLNADGSFTYTPNASFTGTDSFAYSNSANPSLVNIATITVGGPVTASDDNYTMTAGGTLDVPASGVLANDGGGSLSASLVDPPGSGALNLNSDGSFTFAPEPGASGLFYFSYTASDGTYTSEPATVTIRVNSPPMAAGDALTTTEDTPLTESPPGILGNDFDADGDALLAIYASGPAHGVLTLLEDGSFTYTPDANYAGDDQFTYQASDGLDYSDVAIVAVSMTPANDAPVASNEAYSSPQGAQLTVAAAGILANDSDVEGASLYAVFDSNPAHGTLVLQLDGGFTYTPAAGFYGIDSFTYKANDGQLTSNPATVTITIPQALPPVALNDLYYSTDVSTPLTINSPGILGNDSDPNGGVLTAAVVANTTNGTVALNANGGFTYTPNPDYIGIDSFTYCASDPGGLQSPPATAKITVGPDLEVGNFRSDGVQFLIGYRVVGTLPAGFQIGIYASPDGEALGQLLQATPGDMSPGYHVHYLPAAFNDLPSDYYLIVKLDSASALTEATEDNNQKRFEGGAFVVTEPATGDSVLHAHGLDSNDSLGISQSSGTLTFSSSLPFADEQYAAADIDEIHIRAHGGADAAAIDAAFAKPGWVFGGGGDDTLSTGAANDLLFGGPGNDSLYGAAGDDQLDGGADNDTLHGDEGNDDLEGGLDDDMLYGGNGDDVLLGADGNDSLYGDAGNDRFSGGQGDDSYITDGNDVLATVALDDHFNVPKDSVLTRSGLGVLTNDFDNDLGSADDNPAAVLVSGTTNGTVTLNADGTFTYTPLSSYTGPDSFTYRLQDGLLSSNVATVVLNIHEPWDVAINRFYSDGTDLKIEYIVASQATSPYKIAIFASSDGVTLEEQLELVEADLSPGFHPLTIAPTFQDLPHDYFLVAKVDGIDDFEETDESNNAILFSGGPFVVHESGTNRAIVHVHGLDGSDFPDHALVSGASNEVVVSLSRFLPPPTSELGPPPFYDVSGNGLLNEFDLSAFLTRGIVADWHNDGNQIDVSGDGVATALDVQLITDALDAYAAASGSLDREVLLTGSSPAPDPYESYFDVNNDSIFSDLDVRQVTEMVNWLAAPDPKPPLNLPTSPWRVSLYYPTKQYDVNFDGAVNFLDEDPLRALLADGYGQQHSYNADQYDAIHIRLHGGDDTLLATGELPIIAFGGPGDDNLTGASGDDILAGGAGDDSLSGGEGDDLILGGAGDDELDGGAGNDDIAGGSGDDTIDGGDGDDDLSGGSGSDTVSGGNGDDGMFGGPGSDVVDGGEGDDQSNAEDNPPGGSCDGTTTGWTLQDPSNPDQNVNNGATWIVPAECGDVEPEDEEDNENSPDLNLRIDSDNDGVITSSDDDVEDYAGDDDHPGKVIAVANIDSDGDGLPDWADGFDWLNGVTDDNHSPGSSFTPLKLTLPEGIDLSSATFEFTYPASDPAQYGANYYAGKQFDRPTDGPLRIWTKNSSTARDPASVGDGGDFVAPGTHTAEELGITGTKATFYIEAINPSLTTGDHAISVRVIGGGLSSGTIREDSVRVTTSLIQIMASSEPDGSDPLEVDGFAASRLPQYAGANGEPGFNDFRKFYTVHVFDPRDNLDHITVGGQSIPLIEASSLEYVTAQPFMVIRELEQSILNANSVVEFKTEGIDDDGNSLPALVLFSQRPSDVTAGVRVITMQDGHRPVIQFVGWEQEGKSFVFSELAEGADKFIADIVSQSIQELADQGWVAGKPTNKGSFGIAVSDLFRQKLAAKWTWVPWANAKQVKTGMLVELMPDGTNVVRQLSGATQGTATMVEIDAVYLKPGYTPQLHKPLDPNQIIVYEIKTSADGEIDADQLRKLRRIQGGDIRQIWSHLKWKAGTNKLIRNNRYYKALAASEVSLRAKVTLATTLGAVFVLGSADQAFANFDAQVLKLHDFDVSGKTDAEIKEQEGVVLTAFKELLDGMTGGTSDEMTGFMLIKHIYKRLIPAYLTIGSDN